MTSQFTHTGAFADQAANNEMKGPAQLVENGKKAERLFDTDSAPAQESEQVGSKRNRRRVGAQPQLIGDELIEVLAEPVKTFEEENGLHEMAIASRVFSNIGEIFGFEVTDARRHG